MKKKTRKTNCSASVCVEIYYYLYRYIYIYSVINIYIYIYYIILLLYYYVRASFIHACYMSACFQQIKPPEVARWSFWERRLQSNECALVHAAVNDAILPSRPRAQDKKGQGPQQHLLRGKNCEAIAQGHLLITVRNKWNGRECSKFALGLV